jgi:hypothetical protein
MHPELLLDLARERQEGLLREAAQARHAAALVVRPPLRGAVGLGLVRLGARVAGDAAVVLAAARPAAPRS